MKSVTVNNQKYFFLKLTWVDNVITIIDVPLLKSTDEGLMERLTNYKTLAWNRVE